ncbi:OLC1v1006391C1 [Oldenlandia corymbosa var. corymbosa]|uniref:OLC1v1006391C1 n=1 Tax=Oldenlandia corymbosa var. corymbosa TaxID=529605 RepID=A0AAV1DH75_OLDCO|nr:OLC1v1006391C1 [Oldenlandia corymbosa var. corymbosa]
MESIAAGVKKRTGRRKPALLPQARVPVKTIKLDPESQSAPRSVNTSQRLQPRPVEKRIEMFLGDNRVWNNIDTHGIMVQFWNPVETVSGRTLLTAASDKLWKLRTNFMQLSRYRLLTVDYQYWMEDDESQLSPVGRAFKHNSPEYCPDVSCYSIQEFPLRDLAKKCGICQYWALPLCEVDDPQKCIGVLEFVSETSTLRDPLPFNLIINGIEAADLACSGLHPLKIYRCKCRSRKVVSQMLMDDGLKFVGKIHRLPVILVWVPCMCDIPGDDNTGSFAKAESRITKLLPHLMFLGCKMLTCEYVELLNQISCCPAYWVANGRGLVGKAYQLKKPCFLRDISGLSISDYPLVHLIRSSGLAASFAIPLQIINPELPPLVLQTFLPSQHHCDENLDALLKSLLSTVSQEVSAHNVDFGMRPNEEFCVRKSQLDVSNIVYFDVHRSAVTLDSSEALGSVVKEHIPSLNPASVGNFVNDDITARKKSSSPAADPNAQDKPESSEDLSASRNVIITLDDLMQHCGKKLEDAAAALGVTGPTLKRRCEELGMHWWPQLKKHRCDGIQLDPELPSISVEAVEGEVTKASEIGATPDGNAIGKEASAGNPLPTNTMSKVEIDGSYTMIVEATHKEDTVKFPISSNFGIEELREELAESLGIKGEKFKIKYEENGKLLMIAREKELRYHMDGLKSSGQTVMYLSVVPST